MKALAKRSHVRMSPRKLRRVADIIRHQRVSDVLPQLAFLPQRAADPLLLVLKQAIANASTLGMSGTLYITRLEINQGPAFKRWQAVSRGRAHGIKKFSSHIIMELGTNKGNTTLATDKSSKPSESKTTKAKADSKALTKKVENSKKIVAENKKTATKSAKTTEKKSSKSTKKVTTKTNKENK